MITKRKDNIICTAILVAGVLAALVVLYLRTTVPYWRCSEVYKRYHKVEGVRATYIKNFPLNDTLTIGVTLLEATDSAGWEWLMEEFCASDDMVKTANENSEMRRVWARLAPKGHPEEIVEGGIQSGNTEEWEYDMVAISFEQCAISIFDTKSKEDFIALFYYSSDYMTNKTNQFIKK